MTSISSHPKVLSAPAAPNSSPAFTAAEVDLKKAQTEPIIQTEVQDEGLSQKIETLIQNSLKLANEEFSQKVDSLLQSSLELPDEKVSEKIETLAQSALQLTEMKQYENELLEKYNPEVVKALCNQLRNSGITTLNENNRNRFDVWCHYFEVESSFREKVHGTKSSETRLLNHLLKYTQREVYYRLRYTYKGPSLTHEQIILWEKNIELFIRYEKELLNTFDERICHRSLTRPSIISSEILVGLDPIMEVGELKEVIYAYYKDEIVLRAKIESSSMEELREDAEVLKKEAEAIKDSTVSKELFLQLALKAGKSEWLKPVFKQDLIEKQAELFEISRASESWANKQEELIPIPGSGGKEVEGKINQNVVFFLKSIESTRDNIAVFKNARRAASMEALVYDAAIIFGLQNAFVPTKLKTIKDKFGSIQVFQRGLSWDDFYALAPKMTPSVKVPDQVTELPSLTPTQNNAQTAPSPKLVQEPIKSASKSAPAILETHARSSLEAPAKSAKVDLQKEIIDSISMEDFLKAGFAAVMFGNRDLHVGNFFFVPKEDGSHSIVMFDNEESFFHSNHVIKDSKGQCHLPTRNALLIFPQADVPITGSLKKSVQIFVNSFENRFRQFSDYLKSSAGKTTLKHLPRKQLGHYQLKAFKERLVKLIEIMNREEDYTYRDIVYHIFPLYEAFLNLTEYLYPNRPEIMVGYHPADYLCDEVVRKGYMTEKSRDEFLEKIRKYEFK